MSNPPTKMWSGRFRKALLFGVGFVSLWLASSCSAQTYVHRTFTLQDVKLYPGERIVSIDLDIITGKFDQVSPLPAGWHLNINNSTGSASHTTFSGSCDLGAASLWPGELNKIIFVISQEPTNHFTVSGSIHVVDWKQYEKVGSKAERDVPINISNLRFAERTNK